jgi:WD40 repeat protein/serine/threonine protein kinase
MAVPLTCPDVVTLTRLALGQLPPDDIASLQEHLAQCPDCLKNLNDLPTDDLILQAMRSLPAAGPEEEAVERLMERLRCQGPSSDTLWMDTVARHAAAADTPGESNPESYPFLTGQASSSELGWLGDYRVLRVLGSGGMGTVFEAEDSLLQRPVALKLMKPSMACHPEAKQRFLREARAAAAIQHDHIVTIHQVGDDRGIPFLAMQLLRGETLERRLRRCGRLPAAEVVRIGREVARGLAAAHARGLIHRDIKPSNIWLEDKPEGGSMRQDEAPTTTDEPAPTDAAVSLPPSAFRVKILDFGLARAAAETTQATQSSFIAGTPAYMAPEQASDGPIDPRCDLFGLGCVLYRACTGELPFKGVKPLTILWSLAVTEPPPPRQLNPQVPRALSDLIEKLLAKDPAGRPQSAREVSEALRGIEADLVGPSQPPPRPRRRIALVAAVALTLLLTTAGYLYGPAVYRLVTDQGQVVVETDDPDVKVVVKQQEQQITILDAKTNQEVTLKAGTYQIELSPRKEGLRLSATDFTLARGDKQVVRVRFEPQTPKVSGPVHTLTQQDLAWCVQFCLNGTHVISTGGYRYENGKWVAGPDFALRLWDAKTGLEVAKLEGHTAAALCLAVSPDGKRAVSSSLRGDDVHIWNLESRTLSHHLQGHTNEVHTLAFSADGRRVVSSSDDQSVRVWDTESGREVGRIDVDGTVRVWGVDISGNGKRIITVRRGSAEIHHWDAETGKRIDVLQFPGGPPSSFALLPGGHFGLAPIREGNGASEKLVLWNLRTNTIIQTFQPPPGGIGGRLAIAPDGRHVLTGGDDAVVRLWDAATGNELHRYHGHKGPVKQVAFSPDGRWAVSGSWDKTVRIWKLSAEPPGLVHTLVGHKEHVNAAEFCLNGTRVISAGGSMLENGKWVEGSDFVLRLWDAKTGREVRRFDDHENYVLALAVSSDGTRAVSGGEDRIVRLWDLKAEKLIRRFEEGHTGRINNLAFTADGKRVVSASHDKTVGVWDVETGHEIRSLDDDAPVWSVAISGDGKRILSGNRNGVVRLWNGETGQEIRQHPIKKSDAVTSVKFSPDGRLCVAQGKPPEFLVLNPETGEVVQRFRHTWGWVGPVAFSPDGRRILSGGENRCVHLWDAAGGTELYRFEGHTTVVGNVAFSPDGRYAVSAGWDKTVRVWKLPE